LFILATPPMGSKIISLVRNPKRLAIKACPNSCNNTVAKTATTNKRSITPDSKDLARINSAIKTYIRSKMNVQ